MMLLNLLNWNCPKKNQIQHKPSIIEDSPKITERPYFYGFLSANPQKQRGQNSNYTLTENAIIIPKSNIKTLNSWEFGFYISIKEYFGKKQSNNKSKMNNIPTTINKKEQIMTTNKTQITNNDNKEELNVRV